MSYCFVSRGTHSMACAISLSLFLRQTFTFGCNLDLLPSTSFIPCNSTVVDLQVANALHMYRRCQGEL